jgi:hypothetical protein
VPRGAPDGRRGVVSDQPPTPAPDDHDPVVTVRDAEHWFATHGLPWFVEAVDARVVALLKPSRLVPLLALALVLGTFAGGLLGGAVDAASGVLLGASVVVLVLLVYVGGPLRVATMARWAARRVVSELNLLLPLVTRALPLLLLFMTFLFVNTEVWQVASSMSRTTVWGTVWLFTAIGAAFLLTRLPEEVRRVEAMVVRDGVAGACLGTPVEAAAAHVRPDAAHVPLTRTQRANLVLVLLVAQSLQVVLLAVLVLCFFVVFGLLAISDEVIVSWVEPILGPQVPTPIRLFGAEAPAGFPVSNELFQVSLFLSAFAGLYFTVYAVSDANYRAQFFAELDSELERAVGVRAVYRAASARLEAADPSAAP